MPNTIYSNGRLFGNIEIMVGFGDWTQERHLEEIATRLGYLVKEGVIKEVAEGKRDNTTLYWIGSGEENAGYFGLTIDRKLNPTVKAALRLSSSSENKDLIGIAVQAFYKDGCLCGFRTPPKAGR